MRTTDHSKFNNAWYDPGGNVLKRGLWYVVNRCFFKSYLFPFSGLKVSLLRMFGAKAGSYCVIKPGVNIKYPWNLRLGDHVWIGERVWIDNLAPVKIGNHVCLSQGAFLLCGNHNYSKTSFDLMTGEIILEDGAWVGAMSVVCPGVTMKSHSVLSVGSVASSNLEAYGIYRGNPAVKIKEREIRE